MPDTPVTAERPADSRRLRSPDPQLEEAAPQTPDTGRAAVALQLLDAEGPPADGADDAAGAEDTAGSRGGGSASASAAGASGAAGGGADGPGRPRPNGSARGRTVSSSDLFALQRFAGNRAVSSLAARPQRQRAVVQRDPADGDIQTKGIAADDPRLQEPPKPVALEVQVGGLDQAAALIAEGIKENRGDHVIIGVQPTLIVIYDKGGHRLSGPIAMKLPKGVRPDPGVFFLPPGGISRRVMVDPTTLDWSAGDLAGLLVEQKPKAPAGGAPAGGAATAKPAATAQPPAATPGAAGAAAAGPTTYDLRKFVTDPSLIDRALVGHENAANWFVVPQHSGGSGKTGGLGSTTGFTGELAGEGTGDPPNRPPWPVTVDGPKMLPSNATGTWDAKINWAANGNDAFSDQVVSAVGNDIHYRWEMFDITAVAKEHEAKIAAQAHQTRVAIATAESKGMLPPPPPAAGTPGSATPASGGQASASPAAPAATPGSGDASTTVAPADDDYDAQIEAKTHAKSGSGDEITGREAANKAFKDDWRNLAKDTGRAYRDLRDRKGDTLAERESNAQANLLALELLPASILVTAVGSALRWFSELFAGQHQQMEVPFEHEGTFLVRVIATPAVREDKDGNKIIHASSVASRVVQVTSMERMLKEALDTPGADEVEANNALAKAQKETPQNEERIKRLQLEADLARLQNSGDPLELIDKQLEIKRLDLAAAKKKWEGYAVGPILEVQNQIDTLENRRAVYVRQDQLRHEGQGTLAPPTRLNASLISEVTGQRYPLLLSAAPMGMDGNMHVWKILDATSPDSEGHEGRDPNPAEALQKAINKFGEKAQFGRGKIGVRVPESLQKSDGMLAEYRAESQPAGWAIAKARLDDLVAVLAALGLLVSTAGTAGAIIGAAVAAARLIEKYHNGQLHLDSALVTDLLSILGGAGVVAQEASALLRARRMADMVVIMEEGVADATKFEEAAAALKTTSTLAARIETANEILNYAGLIWGNATFVDSMLKTAEDEASGNITHAEARRQRAMAIGGAINNNGMFVGGKYLHAKAAAKEAGGTTAPKTTEHETPSGGGEHPADQGGGGTPHDTELPKTGDDSAGTGKETPPPSDEHKGAAADEPNAKANDEPKPASSQTGTDPNATASGQSGAGSEHPGAIEPKVVGHGGTDPEGRTAPTGAAAREALVSAARGNGDLARAARDAIGNGTWKGELAAAIRDLPEAQRVAAEKALVEARDNLVNDTWAELEKTKYPDLRLENAGTKSFSSDIDATIRPKEEASGTGQAIGDQVKRAGEAAKELSDLLRGKVRGETDAKIDTNVYSFIGEGRVKAPDSAAAGAQQHVDLVVGLAEQMRGQSEAAFKAFEQRVERASGDPRVAAEAKAVIGEARDFHDARQKEWGDAKAKAQADHRGESPAVIERIAREELLGKKKGQLAELLAAPNPDYGAITGKQAEINWFAPDAYATPSAFGQAVAHGQRLKGSARTAAEMKGPELAAKLRERAADLPPDSPRARELARDAALVDSQQRLLESTVKELEAETKAKSPDDARIADLEARAQRIKEAIAAKAEPVVVGELLDTTMPVDKPGPQRLNESAAAAAANLGMLEDHVAHAKNADGKVKAAAKYAGRIAMAEFLSGMRPDITNPIARMIGEFVQSRWGIFEEASAGIMRDMFLRYALETGQQREIVHDAQGVPTGVSDSLKLKFVEDVRNWARDTNAELQTAAIASKAFDNPTEANAGAATGRERPSDGGVSPRESSPGGGGADHESTSSEQTVPAQGDERPTGTPDEPATKGGVSEGTGARPSGPTETEGPKPSPEETPAPDQTGSAHAKTAAAGAIPMGSTPLLNPPGFNQMFDFRLRSVADGHDALRRLGQGDASILAANGVQLPDGYSSQAREWGLAQLPDGSLAIVQGGIDHVDWRGLPPGTVALAHSHPMTPERALRQMGTVGEIARRVSEPQPRDDERPADVDRTHVFPSGADLVYCAAHNVANHDVHTPYVHLGDGVLRTPTGQPGEIPVSFNIAESRHVANFGERPVAEAAVVAHDEQGNVLWIGRLWGFDVDGSSHIFFERPSGLTAADPTTLRDDAATPAGKGGGQGAHGEGSAGRSEGSTPDASDESPDTRRTGPMTAVTPGGESRAGIPEIPGGTSISDDGVATWVRSRRDGNAIVRIEEAFGDFLVTDIYRKSLPPGSGSAMMAEGLRHLKVGPGARIVIGEIINPETVASFKAHEDPRASLLGKTTERALGMIGLTPASVKWEMRRGKLTIVMEVQ